MTGASTSLIIDATMTDSTGGPTTNPVYVLVPPSGDMTGATDYANITAARDTIATVGTQGGVVQLTAANYYLGNNSILLKKGIIFQGIGQGFSNGVIPPTRAATTITGDGTAPAFYFNNVASGSPPSNANTFQTLMVVGVGVSNMILSTFSFAIQIGALYSAGCMFSEFVNVNAVGCGTGFFFENFIECNFENLYADQYSVQGLWFAGSSGPFFCGNSTFRKIFAQTNVASTVLTRNLTFVSRGSTNTSLNDLSVNNIQCNSSVTPVTQAVTMVNTSANMTVADGTKFAVDMPITFSASTNGFLINEVYYVTSVAANVITIANIKGGTNRTASGAAAVNIITQGFELLEVYADPKLGGTQNSIQPCNMSGIDLEGGGTAKMSFLGLSGGDYQFNYLSPSGSTRQMILGASTGCIFRTAGSVGINYQMDNTSGFTCILEGMITEFDPINQFGSDGCGIGIQINKQSGQVAAQRGMLALAGEHHRDIFINADTIGLQLNNTIHLTPASIASGGTFFASSPKSSVYNYSTAGVGTGTLPAITANSIGQFAFISNPSAGILTVSTTSSQNIIGLGSSGTSIAIAVNSCAILISMSNGGTLYWARFA